MILITRNGKLAKTFFVISITGIITYVILAFNSFHTAISTVTRVGKHSNILNNVPKWSKENQIHNDLKYILLWTIFKNIPSPIGEEQYPFVVNNCSFINCFVTTDKELLNGDYSNFDAIIFNMSLILSWRKKFLPQKRSFLQKYVFFSMMPSDDYPICNESLENFFNWTWSYKLYSDIVTPFIEVRDFKGKIVAPSTDVEWSIQEPELSTRLVTRSDAVAMVLDDCRSHITKMTFSKELQYYLKEYNLKMDIYGCGANKCPETGCMNVIRDYYFYLDYEFSLSEDYLTEEVLKAYNNGAVPIIKSGADYTKFLPPGSYIDASTMYPEKLAASIRHILRNPSTYNSYHLWRKRYTITQVNINRGLCDLCELLNDNKRIDLHTAYRTFRRWWNYASLSERCYSKGAVNNTNIFF